ncbi:MAG: DUF1571 domain-containing protein [Bacteroidota bacterium]
MKIFLPLLFLFISSKSFSQPEKSKEIFDKMMVAMKDVKTCSYVLDIQERIKGTFRYDEYIVKLNSAPYKAYAYSVNPNPGAEGLLIEGENNNKAYINPNRFPYITLSLSPYSMLLRKNHQYTILQLGFNFIHKVFEGYLKKYGNTLYDNLHLEQDVISKGRIYYQVVIEKNDFHFEDYKVQPGENMVSIGQKLLLNDYMILEANPEYKHFDDVKAGDVIKVPSVFGKKIILYVDKVTFLPLVQIIYDNKGLYGRVEFSSFVLNPNFTEMDFSKNNKKYGF